MPAINAETEVLLVAEDEELIHGNNYEMALMSCYPGTAGYVFGISASLRVFEKSSANFKSLGEVRFVLGQCWRHPKQANNRVKKGESIL